jgi:paraquat-inducible protein B
MVEPSAGAELPRAMVVRPKRRPSAVWLIPIIAGLVAVGIAVQRLRSEGPTITIEFRAADGIEAGKTFIKYKDVNLGQVTSVHLSPDYSKVEVTAKITKRAAGLMVEDAKFWVVRPTISLSGISGLNTLLSGNYIGFEAGSSANEQTEFVGLDKAPVVSGQLGREFILKARDLGSLSEGSPVYYRRLPVGQVVSYGLAPDGRSVEIRVFVSAPYDKYVTVASRFWNAGGVDIIADANGLDVRTESLIAALVGGIAFDSPQRAADTTSAATDARFDLHRDRSTAMKAPEPGARRYVLHFTETLRGLQVGAPVTFLGLQAGEVTAIDLELDKARRNVRPRVTISFHPERRLADEGAVRRDHPPPIGLGDDKRREAVLQHLIDERGLRAQLRSGNLLTGQMYVAFEYFPRRGKAKIDWSRDTPELPVVPSSLVDLEDKLTGLLEKLDKLPIEEIGKSAQADLQALHEVLTSANKLVARVDTDLAPSLKTSLESMQRTLSSVERSMNHADATLLAPGSPAQQELHNALNEFTRAASSMRMLLDYLERHPETVLRGRTPSNSGDTK